MGGMLALVALTCAAMLRSAGAQMDDDVSASYDYDGTLMLDSRNFRGMTSQGVWVVMFYSYTVVIKSKEEAQICQRFTWLWGDLANRYSKMGGETRGGRSPLPPLRAFLLAWYCCAVLQWGVAGLSPSIHIAKYDASATAERSYVSSLIGSERVEVCFTAVCYFACSGSPLLFLSCNCSAGRNLAWL